MFSSVTGEYPFERSNDAFPRHFAKVTREYLSRSLRVVLISSEREEREKRDEGSSNFCQKFFLKFFVKPNELGLLSARLSIDSFATRVRAERDNNANQIRG